jgi:hypothetical protein
MSNFRIEIVGNESQLVWRHPIHGIFSTKIGGKQYGWHSSLEYARTRLKNAIKACRENERQGDLLKEKEAGSILTLIKRKRFCGYHIR